MVMSARTLYELASQLSREDYISRLLRTAELPDPDPRFPHMPDGAVQELFVGLQGRAALEQAAAFYQFIVTGLTSLHQPLNPDSHVLDFGVGWGRVIRFFSHDVRDEGLLGVDVDPQVISLAQACNVPGSLSVIGPFPPAGNVAPGSLDVIYAYSVFSHLNEAVANDWMIEFARLLKPRGVVVLTTRARSFIELCAQIRDRSKGSSEPSHESALARAFIDTAGSLARYDEGFVVHEPITGGETRPASFYGETVIPEHFMTRTWSRWFELVAWANDPFPGSFQSAAVLRRVPSERS